jgi:hypothetical protein
VNSPRCCSCGKTPAEIGEYVELAEVGEYASPDEAMRKEEGTYNPETNTFACTACYLKMGMPSSPRGWKAGPYG